MGLGLTSGVYRAEYSAPKFRPFVQSFSAAIPAQIGHILLGNRELIMVMIYSVYSFIMTGLLVYLVRDMKTLELIISCLGFISIPCFFLMPESPKWLLIVGRKSEAETVLRKAAEINGVWNGSESEKMLQIVLENQSSVNQESRKPESVFNVLFGDFPALRRNMFLLFFIWFSFTQGYYGLIYNAPTLGWNLHLVFVFPACLAIPLIIVLPFLENKLGRKVMITIPLVTSGLLCLLTSICKTNIPLTITINTLATVSAFASLIVGYNFTKELFPTTIRTSALSLTSVCGRIGALTMPFMALDGGVVTYGLFLLAAGLASIWIWPETKCMTLANTLQEAEDMAKSKNKWLSC